MDRQPTLEGDRLHLRPLTPEDRAALYAVASDPQVWGQHPIHDRWREDVFGGFFDEAMASGGALAIIERASGGIVGSSRFVFQSALAEEPLEIGWTFLATRLWGSGANTELKRLMLGHALAAVERVVFRVGENNLRSRRALEKIGARLTDEIEYGEYRGQPVVHVVYEVDRAGFASGPLS